MVVTAAPLAFGLAARLRVPFPRSPGSHPGVNRQSFLFPDRRFAPRQAWQDGRSPWNAPHNGPRYFVSHLVMFEGKHIPRIPAAQPIRKSVGSVAFDHEMFRSDQSDADSRRDGLMVR